MTRLWPRRLAGRLVLLLVTALAIAQAVVVVVLHDEQRAVAETMAHGQALNQAVTLARLLSHYPPAEATDLNAAFGSRMTCARLEPTPPAAAARAVGKAEARLAETLGRMLHGDFAGPPTVVLRRAESSGDPCGGRPPAGPDRFRGEGAPPHRPAGTYSAEMVVPLTDGRTLVYTSVIEPPDVPIAVVTGSFLFSALAVGAVVVVSVRHQTRSLRDLADAAERLGRGEDAPPLDPRGGPAEIAVAVRAFDTMRDRLRRHMSERLRLLAAVSHDLRTPLTTLRLKAEFVEDEAVRDDLVATLDELTAITEATLAFTRAEASREATRTIDLAELVGEVIGEFRLAGADATLDAPAAVAFQGRPVALKRAVRNVVENAIRYGGSARVALLDAAERVRLVVEDDGPGLPADRIDEAFQPFVRLEPSRSRQTGGIGLGLSIARGIVQSHGGTITLANRPTGGLRVEIGLPRPQA
jgi:signal transduction histidine kinase